MALQVVYLVIILFHMLQVNLYERPRNMSGRASTRSMSVKKFRPKRPMSAMPALGNQVGFYHPGKRIWNINHNQDWRRTSTSQYHSPIFDVHKIFHLVNRKLDSHVCVYSYIRQKYLFIIMYNSIGYTNF